MEENLQKRPASYRRCHQKCAPLPQLATGNINHNLGLEVVIAWQILEESILSLGPLTKIDKVHAYCAQNQFDHNHSHKWRFLIMSYVLSLLARGTICNDNVMK